MNQNLNQKIIDRLQVENNLKWGRFIYNLTQNELALKSGISQGRISMLENGFVLPNDDERGRLAKALGCESDELIFELKKD
ncbi:helix-turn-helix transcriptional regulator [Thermodesulfobacteriota bacterium]